MRTKKNLNNEVNGQFDNKTALKTIEHLKKLYYGMKARVTNPNYRYAKYYKELEGVKFSKRWEGCMFEFFRWALTHGYSPNLKLGRINNTKGFTESNCKFMTYSEVLASRTSNGKPFKGRTHKMPLNITYNARNTNNPYAVLFSRNGERTFVGTYSTLEEAILERDKALKIADKKK